MYNKKLWEEDKWDIHSSSYSSSKYSNISRDDKKDDKLYHEQKYGAKEKSHSSDYMRKEDSIEKDEDKKLFDLDNAEEKKEQHELSEEEIPFKAAKEIFSESRHEATEVNKKKDVKNIEDAIKKAIEEEKRAITMNN